MTVVPTGGKTKRPPRPPRPHPARPARKPYDPFAPLTPAQIRAQAAAYVNAQIAPVIAQINAGLNRQEQQGTANVSALTRQLAAEYVRYGPASRANYAAAEADQGAVDKGLADRLGSLGGSVAGNVGGQLAAINAPAGQQQQAAGLAQVGQGAGNAQFALGSSELARLVAGQASAGEYGAKLPGIAALAGTQQSGALLRQLENARASQTGDIRSKVPGMTADFVNQLQTREFNKAVARQSGLTSIAKTAQQVAYENARLGLAKRGQDVTVRGQDIRAQAARDAAKRRGAQANVKARRSALQKATDTGLKLLDKATSPRTTTVQVPKTNIFGQPVPGQTTSRTVRKGRTTGYYEALHSVEAAITPTLSPYMSPADIIRFAQRLVNARYQPGQYGRPGTGKRKPPGAPGFGKSQRG